MSGDKTTAKPLRRYAVHVDGYNSEPFIAPTASKARYRAYVAFCDATKRIRFLDFVQRCHVLHLGVVR